MTLVTNCLRGALAGLILAAASASVEAETAGPVIKGNVIEGVRDARYCEIIPIVRDRLHLEATVYNTLGLNDCPASVWDSITEEAMKQRFGAITVLLNGPRYFLMDSITAEGATKAGEKIDAGGLALTERASIDVGLFDLLDRAYRETTIDRDTTYLFKAGSPIFMLEAPDGARYVIPPSMARSGARLLRQASSSMPTNMRKKARPIAGR
jgi:hypothetical protein